MWPAGAQTQSRTVAVHRIIWENGSFRNKSGYQSYSIDCYMDWLSHSVKFQLQKTEISSYTYEPAHEIISKNNMCYFMPIM